MLSRFSYRRSGNLTLLELAFFAVLLTLPGVATADVPGKSDAAKGPIAAQADPSKEIGILQRQAAKAIREEKWDSARKAVEEVVEIQTRRYGRQHWQTINALLAVAHLSRIQSLSPEQRKELVTANALLRRANDAKLTPKSEERLKLTEQCRAAYETLLGPEAPETATALTQLARVHYSQHDYLRAEPLYRQAIEIRKKTAGENHPDYANSLNSLALLYVAQDDYARAEPLYRQALEIEKKTLEKTSAIIP